MRQLAHSECFHDNRRHQDWVRRHIHSSLHTSDWDVQISKYFNFTERFKLQLRAEYFNVLNHPNFAPESVSTGAVNGTDQISAFDKINGNAAFGTFRAGQVGDPRVAQLAAKVLF